MGKRRPNIVETLRESQQQTQQTPPTDVSGGEKEEQTRPSVPKMGSNPKAHMNCPICYENFKGKGIQKHWWRVSGVRTRIAYECNQCGHHWTVEKSVTHTILNGGDAIPDA